MCKERRASGFTLIELVLVIAIVAILIALVLPAVHRVRERANRTHCANNLHQVGLAMHAYHGVHRTFPPGVSYRNGAALYPFMSWNTRLLPFLEQNNLWEQTLQAFALDNRFLHNPPHVGLATVVAVYTCPADGRTLTSSTLRSGMRVAFTAYLGVAGSDQFRRDGVLYLDSRTRITEITDGTSNTLLVGERPPSADGRLGWWYAGEGQSKDGSADMVLGVREFNVSTSTYGVNCPTGPYKFGLGRADNACDAFHFWSAHGGEGAHFLFADASLRFVHYSIDPLMPALATRAGGEAVALSD